MLIGAYLRPWNVILLQRNWNLFSVNVAMAGTGLYQLSRKIRFVPKPSSKYHVVDVLSEEHDLLIDFLYRQDYFSDEKDATPQLEA